MKSEHSSTVYEPQEDSFLLQKQVMKYAKGKVLDIGTGSGIQGSTAKKNKKVTSVTYTDINPEVKKVVKNAIITDLFNGVKGRFNTIIFNPPYLPKDELDNEELITTGGKEGYEVIEKFLRGAKSHLEPEGIILLVFSSLTKKSKIDKIIKNLKFKKVQVAKQGLFMEQLYVYLIKSSNDLMHGQRGVVEIKKIKNKLVAIKRKKNDSYNPTIEANFLKVLNKWGIGPKLISYDNSSITIEYIEGERIIDYFENHNKKEILNVIKLMLNQVMFLDKLNINKLELTNPYKHIIVKDNIPYQIDFERCNYTNKTKNVNQFVQFLVSGRLRKIFESKDVKIDKEKILDSARRYKENYDEKYFNVIVTCIK